MDHEEGFEAAGVGFLGELAYQGQEAAVRVEGIPQIELPDLEADRPLEARSPREGTHREPTEDLMWLLDELLRPPDDGVDDIAFPIGAAERCYSSHTSYK